MKNIKDFKMLYWFIICSLLFVPITNSFFVSLKKLVKSVIANNKYEKMVRKLENENEELSNKVKYYKSSQGLRNLVKDRLNKVEDGELLIKFNDQSKMLD